MSENNGEFVELTSLIVNGKNHISRVETEIGVFQIRPLTLGEKAQLDSLSAEGLKTSVSNPTAGKKESQVSVDLKRLQDAEWEAKFTTVALGLSVNGKEYTIKQVRNWNVRSDIFEKLVAEILRLSGLHEKKLEFFRAVRAGERLAQLLLSGVINLGNVADILIVQSRFLLIAMELINNARS